jgi:hypothetical protein
MEASFDEGFHLISLVKERPEERVRMTTSKSNPQNPTCFAFLTYFDMRNDTLWESRGYLAVEMVHHIDCGLETDFATVCSLEVLGF